MICAMCASFINVHGVSVFEGVGYVLMGLWWYIR